MQIQVNIPEDINKHLKIYKIKKGHKNLPTAVIEILEDFFKNETLD